MVQHDTTGTAFGRAMEAADCETLIGQIGEWFDKPYRDPTNALDIAVCVSAGIHAGFERRIDDARRNWRMGEVAEWQSARVAFDNAMRSAVEALGKSPEAELQPRHDPTTPKIDPKWGDPSKRPAIGAGWGQQSA